MPPASDQCIKQSGSLSITLVAVLPQTVQGILLMVNLQSFLYRVTTAAGTDYKLGALVKGIFGSLAVLDRLKLCFVGDGSERTT